MPRHFPDRHANTAIAADLHYGRHPENRCAGCGKPFGISADGGWIAISADFPDLCESCGDLVGAWQEDD